MSRPSSSKAESGRRPSTGSVVCFWKNSGTISARPPKLITTRISATSRPTFFSMISCFIGVGIPGYSSRLRKRLLADGLAALDGHEDVGCHDQHAGYPAQTTDQAHDIARTAGLDRFNEGVHQGAVGVDGTPHKALQNAIDPHGGDVKHGANSGQPEVHGDHAH